MAGFAHICVVLVRGSRLLCLVVHISSKGTKAGNTEGQQGKKKKGNQTRYRNFVCGCRSKSHGALSSSPASLLSYFPLALLFSAAGFGLSLSWVTSKTSAKHYKGHY